MVYWFREVSLVGWLLVAGSGLAWWWGGVYLAAFVVRLRPREQLVVGFGLGWTLFILAANLLMRWLAPGAAGVAAGALVFAAGGLAAWRVQRETPGRRFPWLTSEVWQAWPQLLGLALLTGLFLLINRGLALFDDYHNLPLLSLMAAGDVPPHFYYNPAAPLAYHYGLHVFAAQLVAQAKLFPWSALDFARALALALALVLAWLWFLRRTASRTAAWLGAALVLLGSGARWLLLLLPGGLAARLNTTIELLGSAAQSGPDFSAVMVSAWQIEGSGPLPFPFAFANGLHHPLVIALNGSGALPYVGLLLLLLLGGRRLNWARGLLVGLLLAGLALSAEHIFVLVSAGLGLAVLRTGLALRKYRLLAPWVMALVVGSLLALTQGGVITELARGLVSGVDPASEASYGFHGFRWDWNPAVLSAHFGRLQLFSPLQLLVALAELGPALFLGGWVTLYFARRPLFNRMVETGLGLGAAVIFGLALFLRYGVERDLSRLFGAALWVWLVLGWPLVWGWVSRARPWGRVLAGGAYGITTVGGMALFLVQFLAIARPQLSYFVAPPDAQLSRLYWNRLELDAQIFDPIPYRSITLFGRTAGRVGASLHEPFPEWEALLARPEPTILAAAGYHYVYLDRESWQALEPAQRQAFSAPCVRLVAEAAGVDRDFRRLVDIRACR